MSGYNRSPIGPAMRALSDNREAYIAQSAATKGGKVPPFQAPNRSEKK